MARPAVGVCVIWNDTVSGDIRDRLWYVRRYEAPGMAFVALGFDWVRPSEHRPLCRLFQEVEPSAWGREVWDRATDGLPYPSLRDGEAVWLDGSQPRVIRLNAARPLVEDRTPVVEDAAGDVLAAGEADADAVERGLEQGA